MFNNFNFLFDKEVNLYKNYIDKFISVEQIIYKLEEYLKLLHIIKSEESQYYNISYKRWLFFLESIFIHIDFIYNLDIDFKKNRLYNINKLIEGLSKIAADNQIDIIDILNKEISYTKIFIKETQEILETIKNNLIYSKNKIEKLLSQI